MKCNYIENKLISFLHIKNQLHIYTSSKMHHLHKTHTFSIFISINIFFPNYNFAFDSLLNFVFIFKIRWQYFLLRNIVVKSPGNMLAFLNAFKIPHPPSFELITADQIPISKNFYFNITIFRTFCWDQIIQCLVCILFLTCLKTFYQ